MKRGVRAVIVDARVWGFSVHYMITRKPLQQNFDGYIALLAWSRVHVHHACIGKPIENNSSGKVDSKSWLQFRGMI
jgi:hypothetical protein